MSTVQLELKLATLVVGDSKAPFSIATIQNDSGGSYSITLIAPLYTLSSPYQVPFFSLRYDTTSDWTPVSWTIGKHPTH